jgi:hypothetical protein
VLGAVVICFLLGVAGVLLRRDDSDAGPKSTDPVPSAMPELEGTESAPQTTILVLGVSALNDDDAHLESIWFVSFRLPNTDVYLHGVQLDARRASGGRSLEEVFAWSPKKGASAAFLDDLAIVAPLEPDAIVVLDRDGFAKLVDYLGGIGLSGASYTGEQVLGILDLLADQPESSLHAQADILTAMSHQLPALGATPDLSPLLELVPKHARSSMPPGELAALLAPLLPASPDTLHITPLALQLAP